MGYQDIKLGISKMLISKGFADSAQVFSFKDETDASVNKKFRIERPLIDLQGEGVEYLNNLVRPIFNYTLALGFKISSDKQTFDYDVSQNLIDNVIAYFSNPANYQAFCIKLKIKSVKTEVVEEHLEALLDLEVVDNITLA